LYCQRQNNTVALKCNIFEADEIPYFVVGGQPPTGKQVSLNWG
jgi:hypothetical protein